MPDITMCNPTDCPLRETCYRYTAIPNKYRQSYFTEPPYDESEKDCKYYVELILEK